MVAGNDCAWFEPAHICSIHLVKLLLGEVDAVYLNAVALELGILVGGVVVIALSFCNGHDPFLSCWIPLPATGARNWSSLPVCEDVNLALGVDMVH